MRIILSVLIPPLGVFLQVGIGPQLWINTLLTLLGYIPGVVHAIWYNCYSMTVSRYKQNATV
ncbi:MAG: YqaE/Pmp3 family membrane protein [Pseudomonadales bacterium]